jgi:exonuclease-1
MRAHHCGLPSAHTHSNVLSQVAFVVAPYEADAQLGWLFKAKLVHAVITEDSDLAAYGCTNIFTKMDKYGFGVHVDLSNIHTIKSFASFKGDMFTDMCILSGCDYVDRVPGLGLKKAQKMIENFSTIERVMRQVCAPLVASDGASSACGPRISQGDVTSRR